MVGADMNLGALVSRDLESEFHAGTGTSVKVRVPGAIAAQTKPVSDSTTPLVGGSIEEQFVLVKLTDHVYDSAILSEGDLDLEVTNFGVQVLMPQARAIQNYVERAVAATMSATPVTTGITYSKATPAKAFTQLRKQLRDNGVGTDTPLLAAVGSSVYGDLLDGPVGTFDESGTVRGFKVVESTRLAPNEIVGFVRNAFALVVRAPAVPDGAPYGASVKADNFALRHIRAYDPTVAADRSLVSAFVGVQGMPLAVDKEDGTVDLVENGGAVRILTS